MGERRTIVITGVTRGLERALAVACLRQGPRHDGQPLTVPDF